MRNRFSVDFRSTEKEYQSMFDVSERTARGRLSELVKLGLIKPVGPQKGKHYTLA